MKLLDILLFTSAIAFFVIGIYESMILGIAQAYSIFMVSVGLLFVYSYRRNRKQKQGKDE